ncbi:MAG: porin family protein, partial [Steroidobacteraceae bacterium]
MKKLIWAGAVLAASMSTAALAENPTGFYVGGGYGQFNLDVDSLSDFGNGINSAIDDNDNSYKFFAGYRVLPYLALEVAYVNLGEPGDNLTSSGGNGTYRLKADGFAPSVTGILPLGPFEASAKVGYLYYDVDIQTDLNSGGAPFLTGSHSRSDLFYGVGLGITFIDHLHIKAEYERLDLKNYDKSDNVWLTAA